MQRSTRCRSVYAGPIGARYWRREARGLVHPVIAPFLGRSAVYMVVHQAKSRRAPVDQPDRTDPGVDRLYDLHVRADAEASLKATPPLRHALRTSVIGVASR